MLQHLVDNLEAAPIKEVAIFRHTVFIDGPAVGLASTVNTGGCMQPVADLGRLHQEDTATLAKLIFSQHPLERSIGMAAINAVVNHPDNLPSTPTGNAFAYIEEQGQGANVAVIGHFPKVDRLRKSDNFANFWVFELNPRGEDLGPDQYEEILPQADFVLLTATSLINGSFNRLVDLCPNSFKILLGPSTPLSPVLFDWGIDCLAGSVVCEAAQARCYLAQGASFRHTQGLKQITWFKD